MSHQTPHYRTSKRGRKFVAGRGPSKSVLNQVTVERSATNPDTYIVSGGPFQNVPVMDKKHAEEIAAARRRVIAKRFKRSGRDWWEQ
ncbi:MAG TPA: hypothetical protein VJP79_02175 [Nitrososphaera sp.]|nr:hypothetical protein [Nitrososphaera sp.]